MLQIDNYRNMYNSDRQSNFESHLIVVRVATREKFPEESPWTKKNKISHPRGIFFGEPREFITKKIGHFSRVQKGVKGPLAC